MPYNGVGTFVALPPPDYPAVAGELVKASQHNNNMVDLFGGLSNAVTRDGQSPPTANLPMAGKRFTDAGDAVLAQEYITKRQLTSTASGEGADMIPFKRTAVTGVIQSTVWALLNVQHWDLVLDFGADPTGTTNCTTAVFNFYTACILTLLPGAAPSGRYKVTRGVLAFDSGGLADKGFPTIHTAAGYELFVDSAAPGTAAPILAFTNGVPTSQAGKFWKGGYHGDIQLTGLANTSLTYANDAEHGLSLSGLQEVEFGVVYGYKLGGSALYMRQSLFNNSTLAADIPDLGLVDAGANNPDPSHVGLCLFRGVKAEYCKMAIENLNWVGATQNKYGGIRVIACRAGGIYGTGTDCEAGPISASAWTGWLVDDGSFASVRGGTPSRFTLTNGNECDGGEKLYRFNANSDVTLGVSRAVHRRNNTTANPTTYFPTEVLNLCGGTAPAIRALTASFTHRIEASAGAVLADVGAGFYNFNSTANCNDIEIDCSFIADNSGLGVTKSLLVVNGPTGNGRALVNYEGRAIFNTTWRPGCIVRGTAGITVGTTYNTIAAKIIYPTELYDQGGYYDSANGWFVPEYSGPAYFEGRITLTPNAGATQLQVGIGRASGGVFQATIIDKKHTFSAGKGEETFMFSGRFVLVAGQQYFLVAAQNTGSSNTTTPVSADANLCWSVMMER